MAERFFADFYRRGLWLAAFLSLMLTACSETKLAMTAMKSIGGTNPGAENPSTLPLPSPGVLQYKIGNPYQVAGVWYYPHEDYNYNETGIASWYGPHFHGHNAASGEVYDMEALTAAHQTLPMPCFVRVTNLDNGRSIVVRINDRGPYLHGRIIDLSHRGAQLLGFDLIGTAKVRVAILAKESWQLASILKARNTVQLASLAPAPIPSQAAIAPPPPIDQFATPAPRGVVTTDFLPPPNPPQDPAKLAQAPLPNPTGVLPAIKPAVTQIYVQVGAFANAANADKLSAVLTSFGPAEITPVQIGPQRFFRVRIGPLASVDAGDKMLERVIKAGHPEARLIVN